MSKSKAGRTQVDQQLNWAGNRNKTGGWQSHNPNTGKKFTDSPLKYTPKKLKNSVTTISPTLTNSTEHLDYTILTTYTSVTFTLFLDCFLLFDVWKVLKTSSLTFWSYMKKITKAKNGNEILKQVAVKSHNIVTQAAI